MLRSYEKLGGEIISPDSVSYGLPPIGRFFPIIFQLKRISLQGCSPSRQGGFECRYQAFMHFGFGAKKNQLLGKSITGQLLKQLTERARITIPDYGFRSGCSRSGIAGQRRGRGRWVGTRSARAAHVLTVPVSRCRTNVSPGQLDLSV